MNITCVSRSELLFPPVMHLIHLPHAGGPVEGDGGFFRIHFAANTEFMLWAAGLEYTPASSDAAPMTAGAAATNQWPVQLARGECRNYTTVDGDDIGIIGYTKFKGAHPLSLVFDNRGALDAAGWRLGERVPAGITLSVCNDCKPLEQANAGAGHGAQGAGWAGGAGRRRAPGAGRRTGVG